MKSFNERVMHWKQVKPLLAPYGLETGYLGSILDAKLPMGGSHIDGIEVNDLIVCDATEFLDRNPRLAKYLNVERHKIIENFHNEQQEARDWHNRPLP